MKIGQISGTTQNSNSHTNFKGLGSTLRYWYWNSKAPAQKDATAFITSRRGFIRVTRLIKDTIRVEKYFQETDSSKTIDLVSPKTR